MIDSGLTDEQLGRRINSFAARVQDALTPGTKIEDFISIIDNYAGHVHELSERYIALRAGHAALLPALERAENCIRLLIAHKPVRDVTETLAECEYARRSAKEKM